MGAAYDPWDLIALCVHALLVRDVVPLLRLGTRVLSGADPTG
jgi:hypothetical protein